MFFFFFHDTATTEIYTLSLHDALPICVELVIAHLEKDPPPAVVHHHVARDAGSEKLVVEPDAVGARTIGNIVSLDHSVANVVTLDAGVLVTLGSEEALRVVAQDDISADDHASAFATYEARRAVIEGLICLA